MENSGKITEIKNLYVPQVPAKRKKKELEIDLFRVKKRIRTLTAINILVPNNILVNLIGSIRLLWLAVCWLHK